MYFKNSLIYFSIIAAFIWGLTKSNMAIFIHQKIWSVFAFFLVMQLLSTYILNKVSLANKENLIAIILSETIIRLLFCLFFISIFIFTKEPKLQILVVNFFVLYLCTIIFEIIEKSRKLRRFS